MAEFVTIANATHGKPRHETLEGKSYLAVPSVIMVEGVLPGSQGPLFYPRAEMAKSPASWDHKPAVVYHPTENGQSVSACSPAVLEARKIGLLFNTRFVPGKKPRLITETWIDADRSKIVDGRVMECVDSGAMMELSTGLFLDVEKTPGDFGGKEYAGVATNYRPDHLALLPDQIGACSIADGAGFFRTNSRLTLNQVRRIQTEMAKLLKAPVENGDVSFGDITERLRQILRAANPDDESDLWIADVFADFLVYETGGRLYKTSYTNTDGNLAISGVPEIVSRATVYRDAAGTVLNEDTKTMTKAEIVANLIKAPTNKWAETDRDFLMGLSEENLGKLAQAVNADPEPAPVVPPAEPETPPAEPAANTKPVLTAPVVPAKPVTAEEYIANAPPAVAEVLKTGLAMVAGERAVLVNKITNHPGNVLAKEYLEGRSVDELRGIANLIPATNVAPVTLFAGSGGGSTVANEIKETPLGIPTLTDAK